MRVSRAAFIQQESRDTSYHLGRHGHVEIDRSVLVVKKINEASRD